jgi:hypothetical protein
LGFLVRLRLFLGLVLGLATAAPAAAFPVMEVSGVIDATGAYSRADRIVVPKSRGHINQYAISGSLLMNFQPGWNAQINLGYDHYAHGGQSNIFTIGSDLYWRDRKGTIGLSLAYNDSDAPATPIFTTRKDFETWGVFGEYYPFSGLTLGWKAGGVTGTVGGGYGGAEIIWYENEDLAVHLTGNMAAFRTGNDWWSMGGTLDYLPFSAFPMSFYVGYDYTRISGGNRLNTIFWGLRYHFGDTRSLTTMDRSGPQQWTGGMTPGGRLRF